MYAVGKFEELLAELKGCSEHGSFGYADRSRRIRDVVREHFARRTAKAYGIYVVRSATSREIVYIGKAGTIGSDGNFKGQDLVDRLRNVRTADTSADDWFRSLLRDAGSLRVEHVVLATTPTPGFVEAALLQAYFNEHQRLPRGNHSL